MLSILRKTTAIRSTARITRSPLSSDDDLTAWEIVNASDDEEDLFSFDDDVTTDEDDVTVTTTISHAPDSKEQEEEMDHVHALEVAREHAREVMMAVQAMSVSPPMVKMTTRGYGLYGYDDYEAQVEDEDDEVEDDVDDELVPWKLKDRYGKQRIKKLGKKGVGKSSKRKMPHYYYKA